MTNFVLENPDSRSGQDETNETGGESCTFIATNDQLVQGTNQGSDVGDGVSIRTASTSASGNGNIFSNSLFQFLITFLILVLNLLIGFVFLDKFIYIQIR